MNQAKQQSIDESLRTFLDVNVRGNGLPRLIERMSSRACVIGYAGGSNSVSLNGWKGHFHQWLNDAFPDYGPHEMVNASIGATSSLGGCFAAPRCLGGSTPDLIFIEYTGNDQNRLEADLLNAAEVRQGIDSIIRTLRLNHPQADLCILSMVSLTTTHGPKDESTQQYDDAANAYGVPAINVSDYGRILLAKGRDITGFYQADKYHLTEEGVGNFGAFIANSVLEFALEARGNDESPIIPEGNGVLREPRIVDCGRSFVHGEATSEHFSTRLYPAGETCWSIPFGSKMTFRLEGDLFGLYVVARPTSGCIETRIGDTGYFLSIFDRWFATRPKARLKISQFKKPIPVPGERVSVGLLDYIPELPRVAACLAPHEPPDQWSFDIIGIMVDGKVSV